MDRILDTVVAGGAEILGLHATVAPRRQTSQAAPTLEQYKFTPYLQEKVHTTEELSKYISVLEQHVQQSLKLLLNNGTSSTIPNNALLKELISDAEPVSADKLADFNDEKSSLLTLVKTVFSQAHNDAFVKSVSNLLNSTEVFTTDRLLTNLLNVDTLKPCLDITLENGNPAKIKICELGAADGRTYERVISQINTQPMLKVDYTVTGARVDALKKESLEDLAIKTVPWNLSGEKPKALSNLDLVVYNYGLHKHDDVSQMLSKCSDMLTPRGFLLVHEPTQHFTIPLALSGITTDYSGHSGRTFGPYYNQAGWEATFKASGFEVVSRCSDDLSTLFLCRKSNTSSAIGEQTVISVEGGDFSWVEQVKEAMAAETPAGQNIWLTSCSSASYHNGIIGMTNCLKQEPGGEKIRSVS